MGPEILHFYLTHFLEMSVLWSRTVLRVVKVSSKLWIFQSTPLVFPKHGPWAGSRNITWKPVKNKIPRTCPRPAASKIAAARLSTQYFNGPQRILTHWKLENQDTVKTHSGEPKNCSYSIQL